ncbi:MAG: hypothetical protein GTO42_01710 [Candidatus Latescibacteria bacterium]|nr:hypothetical protein [Candidatus Latescibacterota bacterium]NIO27247.1 hypothetical protein [Candidatus Latescibacterota bacterium]NIO54771.1 hypothetical protein [Candidatus Latescibacterota bacterium]NIT00854.1 hypothetical protein [Candidatus Latescibacterota bacterium]NIT37777.1 hypothetical protein [Candidatus Latescibacterota bacterium]
MLKKTSHLSLIVALALMLPLLGFAAWSYANACDGKGKQTTAQVTMSGCWEAATAAAQECAKTAAAAQSDCTQKTKAAAACAKVCAGTKACCAKKAAALKAKEKATMKAIVSDLPYREATRVVLKGEYICGKCELKKFDYCKAMFKTTDGNIYPLVLNNSVIKMRDLHHSKNGFKITSRVKRLDGIKYLEVSRFQVL